jgi:hypothetical protein
VNDLTYSQLKTVVNDAMRICLRSLDVGETRQARLVAATAVDLCRDGLNGGGSNLSGEEKSKTLVRGILAAACRDLSDCDDMLGQNRLEDPQVESLWNRLLGCLDRLEYVRDWLEGLAVDQLIERVSRLKDRFDQRFGAGLYANPEFVIRRELCSICNDDFRRCIHRDGTVYDGVLCKRIACDAFTRSVSFVKHPIDLRCRVWPWRWDQESRQYSFTPVLDSFRLDDLSDPGVR